MKIRVHKIRKASLFKLIVAAIAVPFGLFFLLCGLAALSGAETVMINSAYVTGLNGLLASILVYPVFILVFAATTWLAAAFGLWVFSWFSHLELEFTDAQPVKDSDPHL